MSDLLRQEVTATAEKIVVKVGTRVLTDAQGKLDLPVSYTHLTLPTTPYV